MKVSLTLQERVTLFNFISQHFKENNVFMWKVIRQANGILSLGEEDMKKFGMEVSDGRISAKEVELAKQKMEYTLPDRVVIEVKKSLQGMADRGSLNGEQFILFEALGMDAGEEAMNPTA